MSQKVLEALQYNYSFNYIIVLKVHYCKLSECNSGFHALSQHFTGNTYLEIYHFFRWSFLKNTK